MSNLVENELVLTGTPASLASARSTLGDPEADEADQRLLNFALLVPMPAGMIDRPPTALTWRGKDNEMRVFTARKRSFAMLGPSGVTPDPLPRDRSVRLRIDPSTGRLVYPLARWNSETMDALYTALRVETAMAEMEHHVNKPPTRRRSRFVGSARGVYLGGMAPPTEPWVVISFEMPDIAPDHTWDAGLVPDLDTVFSDLLRPWEYKAPQAIGALHYLRGDQLLIVPACPAWIRTPREIEWSAVFYISPDHVPEHLLPGWSRTHLEMEFELPVPLA
jgi:RES domain